MKELPFDAEPIPEAELHRWWLNPFGNVSITESNTCETFFVERGSSITMVRLDAQEPGVTRVEFRTNAASNNLFTVGSVPDGSAFREFNFEYGSVQFVGLVGTATEDAVPALGMVVMTPDSCSYTSTEEKA